jgi:hypothetical protein
MGEGDQLSTVTLTSEQFEKLLTRNGNGNGTPKTWQELIWKASMTLGVPTIALAVIILIVYQTVPEWVQANINTQESLRVNLGKQTDIMEETKDTLTEIERSTQEIVEVEQATKVFMEKVRSDHEQQILHHKQADEVHDLQCQTLQAIRDNLTGTP